MSEPDSQAAALSGALFCVGDKVTASEMLDGYDADDWPYTIYCKEGDVLEIREVRPNGWYVVAHPHREPGAGFMARHRELLLAAPDDRGHSQR